MGEINKYSNIIEILNFIVKSKKIDDFLQLFGNRIKDEFMIDLSFDNIKLIDIFKEFDNKYSLNIGFAKDWFNYCSNLNENYIYNFLIDFTEDDKKYICTFLFIYLYCIPYICFLKKESVSESYYNNFIYTSQDLYEQKEYKNSYNVSNYKCASNIEITAGYYHHGLPSLPEKIKRYIRYKDFFDIGAYTGDSALVLKDFSPSRIYSFEPFYELYTILLKTINMNSLKQKIIPINIGLSDIDGSKIFGMTSCNMVYDPTIAKKTFKTSTIKLDSFVFNRGCRPGLLKLDVEGNEYSIIVGGSKALIKKYKPVLLISIYHRAKDFFEIKENIKKWNLNYKFVIQHHNCWRPNIETVLICYPNL